MQFHFQLVCHTHPPTAAWLLCDFCSEMISNTATYCPTRCPTFDLSYIYIKLTYSSNSSSSWSTWWLLTSVMLLEATHLQPHAMKSPKFSNIRFPACLYLIFMCCLYPSGSFWHNIYLCSSLENAHRKRWAVNWEAFPWLSSWGQYTHYWAGDECIVNGIKRQWFIL